MRHPSKAIPPVFDNCTHVLTVDNNVAARDLYRSVISKDDVTGLQDIVETLTKCHDTNLWPFEPLVILAQKLLEMTDFEGALQALSQALELQLEWGILWVSSCDMKE